MMEINLEPDLSSCVQTLAKRRHEAIVRQLLRPDEEVSELEQKAQMLRMFLESTDFRRLRSEYEPYLVEGKRVRFTLRLIGDRAEYDMKIS